MEYPWGEMGGALTLVEEQAWREIEDNLESTIYKLKETLDSLSNILYEEVREV